ncbi:hypothetical protein AALB39_10810 [Lachnospiraceae bacterium 54-53]
MERRSKDISGNPGYGRRSKQLDHMWIVKVFGFQMNPGYFEFWEYYFSEEGIIGKKAIATDHSFS